VCGAETFTLNDAQDYGICNNWQKAFLNIKTFASLTCESVVQW
jgi:hypothetical protein